MVTNATVVLMYHRIGDAHSAWERKYCVAPERFAAHMATLAAHGMRGVRVEDFAAWLEGGPELPAGSILITFDDGFRSVREHALPVLEQHGWPATVFLVTDLIGRQDEWTRGENPHGVTYPLLDADEIRDMAGRGVSFHSHTCSHANLPALGPALLADELSRSRGDLRETFGFSADFLAYPFGHVDDRVESAARAAGYRAAFSTQPGFNRLGVNRFRIRRLDVFGTDTPAMLLRKIKLGSNDGRLGHVARYYVDRLKHRLTRAAP